MSRDLNNLFPFIGFEKHVLTSHDGYMSMFFDAKLFDKDSLNLEDKYNVTEFFKDLFESLNEQIVIQQYFIKYKSSPARIDECPSEQSYALVKDHIDKINETTFFESKLIWCLSFQADFIDKSSSFSLVGSFLNFLTRKISFKQLMDQVDLASAVHVSESHLIGKLDKFNEVMARFRLQIVNQSDFFKFKVMPANKVTSFLSFLGTFDSRFLNMDVQVDDSIALSLPIPDIDPVSINAADALQFKSATPHYASFGSIIRFVGSTMPDFWTNEKTDILGTNSEFIAYSAFSSYSSIKKITTFHTAKVKTEQIAHNPLKRILRKGDIDLEKDNPVVFDRLNKLNEAKNWDIKYGDGVFQVIPFSSDPAEITSSRSRLEASILGGNARMVWESNGSMLAYHSLIPSNMHFSARKLKINSHQFSALSLVYTQNKGIDKIKLLGDKGPLCYFQTPSGERVSFSPYVGQQSLIIGIGETRSGKTFLKNFIAAMMAKWNAQMSFVDIDPGSYPVANHFSGSSKIFELPDYSYNPFSDYLAGVNDHIFHEHMVNMLSLMANEKLTSGEKELIENSLSDLLSMPPKMHTMDYLLSLLPHNLSDKFSRFTTGLNSGFLSNDSHDLLSFINCFNLERVYEVESLSDLAYYTLLFQIVNNFKFKTPKNIPKYLFVDEAHTPLKVPAFQRMVDNLSRTGNKYLIGLSLFTQNAQELGDLPFWQSLRTACGTFIFVANPKMDKDVYQKTFDLSDYELDQIKKLTPRKEFYLIQREANISKRLEFNPSDYYLKNFTSVPTEIENQCEVSL